MADTRKVLGPLHLDGTSQSGRFQAALDPVYVSVDERTSEDLLAFTRELAKKLRYFGPDNQADGDWSRFLPAELDLADVTAFMAAPERFDPSEHPLLFRPHFTLFLSFLELLRLGQGELNTITRRHLDFYYREALRLEARAAIPDRVHVFFELAAGALAARLPAGTLLDAGPDSQGVERAYALDRDLVVGRARVAHLSSLYVERSRTGLAEVRDLYRNDPEQTWLGMFKLALGTTPSGDLSPGEDLPTYPDGRDLNEDFVGDLRAFGVLVAFARESLSMTVFELYQVMRLKARRDESSTEADAEWQAINDLLEKAGQTRDPAFVLDRSQPRAFDANLAAALGGTSPSFAGLPEVETLRDLHDHRLRDDVQVYIQTVLFFTDPDDFDALMQLKNRIDNEWAEVNRLLGVPEPIADPADFDTNVAAALGAVDYSALGVGVTDLDTYYAALVELEDYFSTSPDELLFVALVLDRQADAADWSKVDGILTAVHREKVYARRRALLDATRRSDGPTAMVYQALGLFVDSPAAPTLSIADVGTTLAALGGTYVYAGGATPDTAAKPIDWQRYLRWELNSPDFQHRAWADLASAKAIELSAAIANGGTVTATDYQVTRPYTPTIKSLTVDYSSSLEILMDGSDGSDLSDTSDRSGGRVLLVYPFGSSDIEAERTSDGVPLLPRFDHEGELMIGLANVFPPRSPQGDDVRPPQTVTLLIQVAEGSADPDVETATVEWSYLSGDRWISLDDGRVRRDTTRGLINSGIVEIVLEEARPSTRLADVETASGAAGELFWLRAAVAHDTASLCDTVAIHAQAASATFVERGNAADHFDQPLPAETITGLLAPLPDVAGVSQPYTSYGGRRAEAVSHFNSRVSERLRHKGRALTQWDYERLVLDRFPEIYKVKCLPPSSAAEIGTVRLVVIPDVRNKLPFDPFGPKAPADLLADVADFIAAKTPHTATVEAINAHYVKVKVRVAVRFQEGGNDAYYQQLLGEELNRFLSPWAYDEGADITIGGKIYALSLVDFLDRRPYVDWLADLRLFRSDDGENYHLVQAGDEGGYAVVAERPDSVLVAARDHQVDLIPETGYSEDLLTGIGFMKTELDFVVV